MSPSQAVPSRREIPREHTWNAESVFPSPEAWEAELKSIQADLSQLAKFQSRLASSPSVLLEALQARDELARRAAIVVMYANMCHEVDKTDQSAAVLADKARGMSGQVLAAMAFFEPEMIAIGADQIRRWAAQQKGLEVYQHYFDNLFRKQTHIRSTEVEELLGMLADTFGGPSNTYGMLVDADFTFLPAEDRSGASAPISQSVFQKVMASPDRTLRQTTWERYLDEYLAHKNSLTANLTNSIKQNAFLANARRHPNTLEASLFDNNIPVAVFYNLLDTFRKNLSTWQRYFALRKKALKVDRLHPFDMWAPLTDQRPKVTYQQAVEWICQGLAPMGEEYVNIIRRGCFEERWVDIYPNAGKMAGAFSYGAPGTYPFIVMSFSDEVFSMSTLAHELGHSMHSYLTWKNQPTIYGDYSLFVAETASNFHQAMVRGYLLENNPDPVFQISLIEEAMANFYRYFLIMPTLARFELETHQRIERGEGLNADGMIDLMADLFQEAYGDTVVVDRQRVGMVWATFSHLFADYYVYQYATGISAANALSRRIRSGAPGAVQDYLAFLKSGSSLYPLDALKVAGVDLTSHQPVEDAFAILSSYVDRLEKLIG